MSQPPTKQIFLFVATYTQGDGSRGKGIYVYRLDPATGKLYPLSLTEGIENASFLAISPDQKFLYAASELFDAPEGWIYAYIIDNASGKLSALNRQPSRGPGPVYVSVDQTQRYVVASNYSGAQQLAMFPINADGSLAPASNTQAYEGHGPNTERQEGPHCHSVRIDPSNHFALACDLGVDKVLVYKLDLDGGKLVPGEYPWFDMTPGSGPRHTAFHPNGHYVYVSNELNSTVTALSFDSASGQLEALQTVPTLPDGVDATNNTPSDIHVTPNGRYLYTANRGHNSLAIYAIDQKSGLLSIVGHQLTKGDWPRNFAIDPTGTFLLVAHQKGDTIVTFRIREDGRLEDTGQIADVPTPVCLQMMAI